SRKLQRRAGKKPRLDVPGNFQIAFHYDTIRQLQQQHDKHQQAAPKPEVEFHHVDLSWLVSKCESTNRKNQQDERQQEKNAARGRELLHDCPEQRLGDEPESAKSELAFRALAEARRIEPIARTRILFELRPELIDFETFTDALPEALRICSQS